MLRRMLVLVTATASTALTASTVLAATAATAASGPTSGPVGTPSSVSAPAADGKVNLCIVKINDTKYTTSYAIDVFKGSDKVAIAFFASGKNGKPGCAPNLLTLPPGMYIAELENYSWTRTTKATVKAPGAKPKPVTFKGSKQAGKVRVGFPIKSGTTTVTFYTKRV
jgi:hypothetical protein